VSWSLVGLVTLLYSVGVDFVKYVLVITGIGTRTNAILGFSILVIVFLLFMLFKEVKNLEVKLSVLNDELSLVRVQSRRRKGKT